ncbi:hypothetical protein KBI33_01215 [Candidatus Shapirobacteria bacterium]|nr:hypothetical protein [Candidatus Shapirobacteria bacterium]
MDKLPFSLNFFKQIECFQEIERLDKQFDEMLLEWKKGGYKKGGISESININYPTWEIEKKILFWASREHKHLGSPITTTHLSDESFQKDIHCTETELEFAGKEEVLKNLTSRGLASWQNGAVVSQKGLDYGLVIADLYEIKKDENIKRGETEYREELLVKRKIRWFGYKLIYFSALTLIFSSLIFLGLEIFRAANIAIPFLNITIKTGLKYLVVLMGFIPAFLFLLGLFFSNI